MPDINDPGILKFLEGTTFPKQVFLFVLLGLSLLLSFVLILCVFFRYFYVRRRDRLKNRVHNLSTTWHYVSPRSPSIHRTRLSHIMNLNDMY